MSESRPSARVANRAPTFTRTEATPIIEVPARPSDQDRFLVPGVNSYLRIYRMGECGIIVTREYGKWHLSISHPGRYPRWDELASARYRLLPKSATVAMLLPPMEEYINIHEHCFHLHEIEDRA